jgi:protein FrlC
LETGWKQLRRSIIELLDYSSKFQINLLIEPAHKFESNLIQTIDEAMQMIEEIGSNKIGILMDIGHVNLNCENNTSALMKLKGIPIHIHINDNNGDIDAHLIPGDGNIQFEPFLNALKQINYNDFISVELGFQYTVNPDDAVKKSIYFLKSLERGNPIKT